MFLIFFKFSDLKLEPSRFEIVTWFEFQQISIIFRRRLFPHIIHPISMNQIPHQSFQLLHFCGPRTLSRWEDVHQSSRISSPIHKAALLRRFLHFYLTLSAQIQGRTYTKEHLGHIH